MSKIVLKTWLIKIMISGVSVVHKKHWCNWVIIKYKIGEESVQIWTFKLILTFLGHGLL